MAVNLRENQITMGELLDHPAARRLLLRELPILAHHPMIAMGREMTLERAIALGAGWLPHHRVESILEQLRRL